MTTREVQVHRHACDGPTCFTTVSRDEPGLPPEWIEFTVNGVADTDEMHAALYHFHTRRCFAEWIGERVTARWGTLNAGAITRPLGLLLQVRGSEQAIDATVEEVDRRQAAEATLEASRRNAELEASRGESAPEPADPDPAAEAAEAPG